MGIETFNYIDSLNTANPTSTDNVSEGDDHIRGIKTTLKNTFPNVNAAVNATDEELNLVDGVTRIVDSTSATGSAKLPSGTTAQRDGSPSAGYLRFNSTDGGFEGYDGTSWGSVGGGATGGGSDAVFVENGQTVTTSYTIPSGSNAHSVGPITINSGVVVTVSSGSNWVIS